MTLVDEPIVGEPMVDEPEDFVPIQMLTGFGRVNRAEFLDQMFSLRHIIGVVGSGYRTTEQHSDQVPAVSSEVESANIDFFAVGSAIEICVVEAVRSRESNSQCNWSRK
jgi:hypothetical protein